MHFLSRSKRKIIAFIVLIINPIVFGVTVPTTQPLPTSCGDMSFSVAGTFFVKPDQKWIYSVTSNSILDQQANVEYELRQDNILIEVWNDRQFSYLFENPGNYLLKTILRRSEQCVQATEHTITVANQIRLGIGLTEKNSSFLAQSISDQGIGFVLLPAVTDTMKEEATIKWLQQIAYFLPSSDVLFVEESQARLLFNHLDDMRTYGIGFPERIILVGKIGTSALRRLLHQSPTISEFSEIAITPTPYLSSVIQQLLNGQSLGQLDVVRLVHLQDNTTSRRLPLSKATDYLLTNGMSINFLLFLLGIPIIVLCLVILKQVVGLNVWGIYYLLLTGAATIFVGREIATLMFLAAFLGQLFSHLITQKIYLLYAPKVWLTITLTCISYILLNILLPQFWYNIQMPSEAIYAFFPLMTFSLMIQYIYPHYNSFIKKERWIWFIQFLIGITSIIVLLQRNRLQQFVLGYPDSILLVVIFIIYIGRFSGLQLGEYIRFWPLIKKHLKEEE
jgi:hypothetical protein